LFKSFRIPQEGFPMFISHRFGSLESLSRARHWLTALGFEVAPFDPHTHDVSRLSLRVGLSEASAALTLIDSIEQSDPEGWPSFLTLPKTLHHHDAHTLHGHHDPEHGPRHTPIHWQKPEETTSNDPVSNMVSEYMLSRWE
jgi:hypothetical protein